MLLVSEPYVHVYQLVSPLPLRLVSRYRREVEARSKFRGSLPPPSQCFLSLLSPSSSFASNEVLFFAPPTSEKYEADVHVWLTAVIQFQNISFGCAKVYFTIVINGFTCHPLLFSLYPVPLPSSLFSALSSSPLAPPPSRPGVLPL